MATPKMEVRTNRRGFEERYVAGRHLKLEELREAALVLTEGQRYISKTNIPAYPLPEFHVSHLKHDTDSVGLNGIREKGGFRNGFYTGTEISSLQWFSLKVSPEEIKEAESRPMKITNPVWTEEQIKSYSWEVDLKDFATSPALLNKNKKGELEPGKSRFGPYRFTFSVEEVLDAYKKQFCDGADPVMREMETVLYKQEVVYGILIHSPADQKQFSEKYPLLSENPDPIVSFTDGRFIWTSQAMCETHWYQLVKNDAGKKIEAEGTGWKPEFYVWDHVAIALYVGDKTLKFDNLREKLTFCEKAEVTVSRFTYFPPFEEAEQQVQKLWPDHPTPLMRDGEKPVKEEDDSDKMEQ